MKLSIVVIFHNMRREARRTLHSLSPGHQDVPAEDYEVIAIDNGSAAPLDGAWVEGLAPNFRYHSHRTASPSPVEAVNAGARMARGAALAVIVDGARMASPGLVRFSLLGLGLVPEPLVYSLSWHLGPGIQSASMLDGYGQAAEDRMLEAVDWQQNGYRLFEVATLAPSSAGGFLGNVPREFSWFAMQRATFLAMGGFEPRFRCPGGGMMNHDFRERVVARPGQGLVALLGEGVFHQFHGGVATNVRIEDTPRDRFKEEYAAIRGHRYRRGPAPDPLYLGTLPTAARRFLGAPA